MIFASQQFAQRLVHLLALAESFKLEFNPIAISVVMDAVIASGKGLDAEIWVTRSRRRSGEGSEFILFPTHDLIFILCFFGTILLLFRRCGRGETRGCVLVSSLSPAALPAGYDIGLRRLLFLADIFRDCWWV